MSVSGSPVIGEARQQAAERLRSLAVAHWIEQGRNPAPLAPKAKQPPRGPVSLPEDRACYPVSATMKHACLLACCAALALPANESALSKLWLGLPARAAVVIYGVGLLPIIVLPVAYAMTFETLTLSSEDVDRVRAVARQHKSTESAANQLEASAE